jgi:hypothetical protein
MARPAITAVVPVQAILSRAGAMVKAGAGMSPMAYLSSDIKAIATSRAAASGKATMTAVGKAAGASFASAAGKAALAARGASAATARGVSGAFAFLVGAIKSQAATRLSSATLHAYLTASIQVTAKARTQFSHVWLSAQAKAVTAARGAVSAAFYNLTPVAERTLTFARNTTLQFNRIISLIGRW